MQQLKGVSFASSHSPPMVEPSSDAIACLALSESAPVRFSLHAANTAPASTTMPTCPLLRTFAEAYAQPMPQSTCATQCAASPNVAQGDGRVIAR
jgi:hypothetical protein